MKIIQSHLKSIKYLAIILFIGGLMIIPQMASAKSRGADLIISYIGNNTYRATLRVCFRCDILGSNPSWATSSYKPVLYLRAGSNADSSAGAASFSMTYQSQKIISHTCTTNPSYGCTNKASINIKEALFTVDIDMTSTQMKKILSSSKCEDLFFFIHDYSMWRQDFNNKCDITELVLTSTLKVKNLNACKNKNNIAPVNLLPRPYSIYYLQNNAIASGFTDTNEFDQLSFEMGNVLTHEPPSTNYCYGIPTGLTKVPLTPYCPTTPTTPYTCTPSYKTNPARGFYFDTITGDMVFMPTVNGEVTMFATYIKEYRRDTSGKLVLIAINTRESNFYVIDNKNDNQPGFNIAFPNMNLCVDEYTCNTLFNVTDDPTPSQTSMDSLIVVIPYQLPWMKSSSPTYVKNNSVNWKVCFKPTIKDTTAGNILIPILIHDNHCDYLRYYSRTLVVKVNNKPFANREIKYLGCNRLAVRAYNQNTDGIKINWQITNNINDAIVLGQGLTDTLKLYGNAKYYIRALMSNGTNCFNSFLDSITITDNPAEIILSKTESISKGSDSFSCKVSDYFLKPIKVIGKGPISYQWYGGNINALDIRLNNAWQVNTDNFAKISTDSFVNLKTHSDTLVFVTITDANGCKASAYQRIGFAKAEAIKWKSNPLPPICYNTKELMLLSPTNKFLGAATVSGKITTINGKNIDSLGPDKYKITLPTSSKNNQEILTLIAYYDTLTCHSSDTTTLTVLFQPKFELRGDTFSQCTDFPELALNNLIKSRPSNTKTMTWTSLNWPKNSSKPTLYNASTSIEDFRIFNNKDSLPIGIYRFKACATDTINGCTWCDTSVALATPVRYSTGTDKTMCPNDPFLPVFHQVKFNNKVIDSATFNYRLVSFNYDTTRADFPKNYLLPNMRFNPHAGIGNYKFSAIPTQLCWRGISFEISVLDTPYVHIITDPKDSSVLPIATIFFDANTNGSRLRWDFGTGNAADTNTVKSLNWAYDKKVAVYPVKLRAWGDNGCWGEDRINYIITDINGINHWKIGSDISADLQLLNPNYQFVELRLMDMSGKTVFRSRQNQGIKSVSVSEGSYLYQMEVKKSGIKASEFYNGKVFIQAK